MRISANKGKNDTGVSNWTTHGAKGIKKVELAKKLNKRPSEITKWLSGTQNITLDILTMISFALGVEISSLFVKEEKQYNLGATSSFLTSVKEPK
ncbi:MAG: helix-turn-helix transcriptional regulator [Saprospiraceae bacterium]|nr:helix-turn-helix transcriptional regulator [Candidatus Defluviibacterium haderslevense]